MADKGIAGARLTKLGRYEVLSELGKGAMGIVYLAKDPVIGRMVAIKTIRASSVGDDDSESREFRERFVREAQTAGILSHPNIVTIHDIGEDAESQTSFIAMEYIEGKNLKSLLAEKTSFTYDQIADMIAQVAEAIDYAHRKGIIHRDIKPANIIITTDEKVKITDFGIAKVASSNLTTTGQFLGTPNYMSPEQVSGAPVDGRSDIFSLGVVLYELLTKRKPFVGENLTAISYKIVHEDFTPPAELAGEVPPEFNPIVARAMAKDPWNRYQRGKDLALALHQLRAHLDEQKALQDLGTIVSEAEFIPTLRLTNLDELVAESAVGARVMPPPAPREDHSSGEAAPPATAGSSGRRTPARAANPVAPAVDKRAGEALAPAPTTAASSAARGSAAEVSADIMPVPAGGATQAEPVRLKAEGPREAPAAGGEATRPSGRGGGKVGPAPQKGAAPVPSRPAEAPGRGVLRRLSQWKKLGRSEVNPVWVWKIVAAAVFFWAAVVAGLAFRRVIVSRPTAPFDAALAQETDQRKRSLKEAKTLFEAGRYEQSLALFRRVLARSPNNAEARQYAQRAERALRGRDERAHKTAEADKAFSLAQAAFSQGSYEEAKKRAEEVLALDAGRTQAQKLRDDAAEKIALAEAAKKKPGRPPAPAVARRAPASSSQARLERPAPQLTNAPAPAASATATLRLLFNSPISEGNLMVAVNDQILLRKQFVFKRRESIFKTVKETGTVDESIPVKTGALSVKVWLSGPDIPSSILATASGQTSGGETRILRVDYTGGRLSAKVQ